MFSLFPIRKKLIQNRAWNSRILTLFALLLPVAVKYGFSYSKTKKLINKYEIGLVDINKYQTEALDRVFSRYNHTKFAQDKKLHFQGRDSLLKAPLLRVADLTQDPMDLCPELNSEVDICATSGSSGLPKVFMLGKQRGPVETAFVHHAWQRAGFRHNFARAVFRGIDQFSDSSELFRWEPLLRELQISPFQLKESNLSLVWSEICRRKIKFIHGYPSTIEVLANWLAHVNGDDAHSLRVRGLLLISEEVHDHQSLVFNKAFPNAKQVSFYGQSEKVAFGFQDPIDTSIYTFSPLYGVTELLDDDGYPVSKPGELGNLYSTGLQFTGTTFIRYEIGDVAELIEPPKESNHYSLKVRNIKSRWSNKQVIGSDGQSISIAAVNVHSSELLAFSRIQFLQKVQGELEVHLVPRDSSYTEALDNLRKMFQIKFGQSLKVKLVIVDQVKLNSRGKAKLFIPLVSQND